MGVYTTETIFSIDDKASKQLTAIIGKVELLNKHLTDTQAVANRASKSLESLGIISKAVAGSFNAFSTSLNGLGTKLTNFTRGTGGAESALSALGNAASMFEIKMALVNETLAKTVLEMRELKTMSHMNLGVTNNMRTTGSGTGRGARGGSHGGGLGHFVGETLNAVMTGEIVGEMVAPALDPALEFQNQANRLKGLAITPQQRLEARKAAFDISTTIPNTTPTEAMEAILQSYGISQSMPLAIKSAEMTAQLNTIMIANKSRMPGIGDDMGKLTSTMERSAELTQNLPKTPDDIEGIGRQKKFYEGFAKMSIQEGGTVSPELYLQYLKYARSAGIALDDKAMFVDAPTLIQQFGAGAGQMYQQYFRMFGQGVMPKSVIQTMMQIGAIDPKKAMANGGMSETTGTHDIVRRGLVDPELFFRNPGEWNDKRIILPLLKKARKDKIIDAKSDSDEDLHAAFEKIPKEKLISTLQPAITGMAAGRSDMLIKMALMRRQTDSKFESFNQMEGVDSMYSNAMDSAGVQLQELSKQFKTAATIFGESNAVMSPLVGTLKSLNQSMTNLNTMLVNFDKLFPWLHKIGENPVVKTVGGAVGGAAKAFNPLEQAYKMGDMLGASVQAWFGAKDQEPMTADMQDLIKRPPHMPDSFFPKRETVSAPKQQPMASTAPPITINLPPMANAEAIKADILDMTLRVLAKHGHVHLATGSTATGTWNTPALARGTQ